MSNYQFTPAPTFGVTEYPFTTFRESFSNAELDRIIEIGDSIPTIEATIGSDGGTDDNIRRSKISWIPQNDQTLWIYDKLAWVIRQLNGQFYKFDMWGFSEDLQYTTYHEEDEGHYSWHQDLGVIGGGGPRKLSLVLQLTDPDEYEGGDLEILTGSTPTPVLKQRGLIAVFPSYQLHRVTPVTKGKRRTLVVWACGPEFK
jgi:PKHD-type hydroxylase